MPTRCWSRPARAWRPSAIRPAPACRRGGRSTRWCSNTTTSPQLDEAFALHGNEIACVMIEPIAGNMNFVRASVPFMQRLRELCTQHGALLVFDEVMTGFRVALGGAQSALRARHPRLRARPQRVRQGHRRRHAAGGLRRQARGDGAARAARPGLPGRHAVGQPGRHRLRPGDAARDRQARLLRRAGGAHARRWSTACSTRPQAAGVPLSRRQRRRHVRLLLRRRAAAELRRGDGDRQGALQPLLPRHAGRAASTSRRRCTKPASSARRTAHADIAATVAAARRELASRKSPCSARRLPREKVIRAA